MSKDQRVDYDTYDAFLQASKSLEIFNQLIAMRHRAHYERGETLNEWVFLGRYTFDSCGNIGKFIGENIPADMIPRIQPIMTQYQFDKLFPNTSFWSSAADIPPAHIICPICISYWSITDCHDTVVRHHTEVVKLDGYGDTGTTLAMMKKCWSEKWEAVWRLQPECSIRNDRYIDLTIVKSKMGPEYDRPANERGWIAPTDDYQICPGDEALINIWTYRHRNCHRKHLAKTQKKSFRGIFLAAGYKNIIFIQTPNEYCHDKFCCAPWYHVIADGISFTIGWRKQVINIESNDYRINFIKLFSQEDVTKDAHYIHAWGEEKCTQYLKTIRESLNSK